MESVKTPLKVNYVIYTEVIAVKKEILRIYRGGIGEAAVYDEIDRGWFMHLRGSFESIYLGLEQPRFNQGDKIKITFERVE